MRGARDSDFSPRLLGLREEPPRPVPRLVAGVLAALLIGLLLWAVFGRLDIVARASGKLVPESRVQVVQPLDGGRVDEILVEEGESVSAGQPLLRMDARQSTAQLERYRQRLELARLQRRRINAALTGAPFERQSDDDPELFDKVRSEFESEREAYQRARDRQKAALERARAELSVARNVKESLAETVGVERRYEAAYSELGQQKAVAELDILERRRARIDAQAELASQRQRIQELEGRIRESRAELERVEAQRRQRLVEQRNQLIGRIFRLEAQWQTQRIRNGLLELRAPEAGVVKNLAVHTEGQVVPSGNVLLSIVPSDEPMRAEVMISNRDVGFVRPGQDVRVKLAAYPFQRFGTIHGTVEMVSPDARDPGGAAGRVSAGSTDRPGQGAGRYTAVVALDRQQIEYEGETLNLRAGMRVTSEIKLGHRSVLEYVISPVSKTLDYAGKER